MKFENQSNGERSPAANLPDGFQRLAQEHRVLLKERVNAMQELTGAFLNYSVQTANNFVVQSVVGEQAGELILSCREVQDMQALIGMNLGGALDAAGVDIGGAYAGRDKAPFRIAIGLPPETVGPKTMMVTCPEGVVAGQQLMVPTPEGQQITVAVPPNVSPGMQFQVALPSLAQPAQAPAAQGMGGMLEGLIPGAEPNNDTPFLYLERPFAFDCLCFNRPVVEVSVVTGGQKRRLGCISDPWACIDMTFNIHMGADASEASPPTLVVKGPACQPGAHCQMCGLCCGCRVCREAYLEVTDPSWGDKTVAFITKGWAGGMQELFTSANTFFVDFGVVKEPEYKAMLLATALFVNYRFFEGKGGEQHSND